MNTTPITVFIDANGNFRNIFIAKDAEILGDHGPIQRLIPFDKKVVLRKDACRLIPEHADKRAARELFTTILLACYPLNAHNRSRKPFTSAILKHGFTLVYDADPEKKRIHIDDIVGNLLFV